MVERPLRAPHPAARAHHLVQSVPCSSGEEPYSIAMALLDAGVPPARFQIDAVDISERMVEFARRACYGRNSFRGDNLSYRDRYFTETADGHQPTTGIEVIQFGTATPWRLAAMAQAKKVLASLMAYDSASDSGTISTTITTSSASEAASAVRPPQRATSRWYSGQLSGQTHQVHTAVALWTGDRLLKAVSITHVRMRPLELDEIARYCDSGEPFGKAGAYGIQGLAGAFVANIDGSYTR
ncbi:Maf family protein [Lactiplantibacillus plantarum]|uniref:Maf family protein n=1 Tax=Lactiplantibacillus plantarum TaxID=1590 RepID=UPI004046081D